MQITMTEIVITLLCETRSLGPKSHLIVRCKPDGFDDGIRRINDPAIT